MLVSTLWPCEMPTIPLQADETYAEADTQHQRAIRRKVTPHRHQEGNEAIQTLRGGKGGKNHVTGRLCGVFLQRTFSGFTRDCRTITTANAGEGQHQTQTEIT